jgi:hypothetical protein
MVSEVSVQSQLALLLWTWCKAEHHGSQSMWWGRLLTTWWPGSSGGKGGKGSGLEIRNTLQRHGDLTSSFFLIVVLGGVHCGIYKSSYNISNLSYLNSPLSTIVPYPPPLPIPGLVSTGIIFAFPYMCTHFLYGIPTPFPYHLTPATGQPPHWQDLFHPPVLPLTSSY